MTTASTAPVATSPRLPARSYRPRWSQYVPFAPRSILRRWRGTIGMVIGVGIALSLTMTFLAVSAGTNALLTDDYRQSGVNLYLYTKGGNPVPMLAGESTGVIRQARYELARVRALPGVGAAIGVMSLELERDTGAARRRGTAPSIIMAIGVDGDPRTIPDLVVMKAGRWPERDNEVVVGNRVARQLNLSVGDTLRLSGRDVTITGIGRLRAVGTYGTDSFLYVDYNAFRDRVGVGDALSTILAHVDQPANLRQATTATGALSAHTPAEIIDRIMVLMRSDQATNWVMSLMALGIGALFVSSMLGRSVVERRTEFATLKAIGVPKRAILMLVTLEALLVCLAATLLGIAISLALGQWINTTIAEQYGFENLYRPDAMAFLTVLGLALALGLLAGLLPARRATRVDPVEILREA